MKRDQLERLLADDEIAPSAGFTASVMHAVRQEAEAPLPIAFPWKCALPGLAMAVLTMILIVVVVGMQVVRPAPTAASEWRAPMGLLLQPGISEQGIWALAALAVSFLCVRLSVRYSLRGL
jgi:hypothetical protein